MLFWAKMNLALMATAAVMLASGTGWVTNASAAGDPASQPATTRPVPPASQPASKTGTLTGKVTDENGAAVEGAKVVVYVRDPQPPHGKLQVAQGVSQADGSFEITVEAQEGIAVNVTDKSGAAFRAKGGIVVKPGEPTDLGQIKLFVPRG